MKNKEKKICLLTNDVETTSIWHNSLRKLTGKRVLEEGMPLLLDLYQKYNVKSTFYFTGRIAKLYPQVVKMILPYGHEVASHGMSHERIDGFDVISLKKQICHLKQSKELLEDISGQEVISFRAPALRVNHHTVQALEQTGYMIDSSVASQRFDMFMSFGSFNKMNWIFSPRKPYRVSRKSIFKKGNSEILEVPLSASIMPYVGTTMRVFPKITRLQRRLLSLETSLTGKPIVFDVHPNEFIDESNEKSENASRSSNFIKSILQDKIRRKLKIKNLGLKGLKIYDNEINYFSSNKFIFKTVRDYCKELEL